jgi:ubiquinone/menaquinone biosynthesis C-methylase UbiE
MPLVNLLQSLPKSKRPILLRKQKKCKKSIHIASKFSKDYFDGKREHGYGGYYYDGRWKKVAKEMIKFFKIKKNYKILDIGCAKGYLVKEFNDLGIECYGIDISDYAIEKCHKDIKKKIFYGNAMNIPFPNNFFDVVISINCAHNLELKGCMKAIKEMNRVCRTNKCFLQVDSYNNIQQKKIFEDWVLTAKTHFYPKKWTEIFKKCCYKGYWNWTILK